MTLTQTAYYTRTAIKYLIVLLVVATTLWVAWGAVFSLYRMLIPKSPEKPETTFGVLPKLDVPATSGAQTFSYSLQTITGDVPDNFPNLMNIYFMPTAQISFLNLDEARALASRLGYTGGETQLTDIIWRFGHPRVPGTIDINIVNKTFAINYNLASDQEPLTLDAPQEADAQREATQLLTSNSLLDSDLTRGAIQLKKFKYDTSLPYLVPAISLSEANFIRVEFSRGNYGEYQVITAQKDRANVWFLVSGSPSRDKRIIAGEYHHFPVSQQLSTYPIKTAKQGWEELVNGQGIVLSKPGSNTSAVTVRDIYLAYFDSGKPQQFLQPVIVFDGDSDFRAIVPAVTDQYYSTSEKSNQ